MQASWRATLQVLFRGAAIAGALALLALLAVRAMPAGAQGSGFECTDGMAGPFPCENLDLESTTTLPQLGSFSGNDIWGWTDPVTGREYAMVGTANGTGFVDVTDSGNPVVLGTLPRAGVGNSLFWSDIKTNGDHAFIVSEGTASGMQVFDLTRLRGLNGLPTPELFDEDAFYDGTSNTHNIWINEETDFAYLLGSDTCESVNGDEDEAGGLHMVNISDPLDPQFAGCALVPLDGDVDTPANNYVHDVECIVYDGPDADYTGREICVGANEDAFIVYDVTDKSSPAIISSTTYPSVAYAHQGSFTPDRKWVIFGDELDEQNGTVDNTTTYISDFSDLDDPSDPMAYAHETGSIDHNLYVRGDLIFASNYMAGQRIFTYDDELLAAGQLDEVAFLDTVPGADIADFGGVWSNYYFADTNKLIVSGNEASTHGLFVMTPRLGGNGGGGNGGGGGGVPVEGKCRGLEPTIFGTDGADNITGTPGRDIILAGRGGDTVDALGGNDVVCAGRGNDVVGGAGGDDKIGGGKGGDKLHGGPGDDSIKGGAVGDDLRGGGGGDILRGNGGKDAARGGAGSDTLRGGSRGDKLNGGRGEDRVSGLNGKDDLQGGADDDVITGGSSGDDLGGGEGSDVLRGGKGPDRLDGGPRSDTCNGGPGKDKKVACEA